MRCAQKSKTLNREQGVKASLRGKDAAEKYWQQASTGETKK